MLAHGDCTLALGSARSAVASRSFDCVHVSASVDDSTVAPVGDSAVAPPSSASCAGGSRRPWRCASHTGPHTGQRAADRHVPCPRAAHTVPVAAAGAEDDAAPRCVAATDASSASCSSARAALALNASSSAPRPCSASHCRCLACAARTANSRGSLDLHSAPFRHPPTLSPSAPKPPTAPPRPSTRALRCRASAAASAARFAGSRGLCVFGSRRLPSAIGMFCASSTTPRAR
mmetsp:Transcript_37649/g.79172  ORF Transcript_37649/g.79172 Transcript_37649/m.79172 type:complete len:232 (+) Transcript_37649:1076-1771(+)